MTRSTKRQSTRKENSNPMFILLIKMVKLY